jgi:dethiobiotin synthetase
MTAFFITGTDTEIGKTFVTCTLLHAARARGLAPSA